MKDVTCKHCGSADVYWKNVGDGHKLFDVRTDKRHFCQAFQNKTASRQLPPDVLLETFHHEFMRLVNAFPHAPLDPDDLPMLLEKAKTNTLLRLI